MIHPTRTNLLLLKEKIKSLTDSAGILKSRRQALIREFLNTALPFLRTRDNIRKMYGKAIEELALSIGHEGMDCIKSITFITKREMGVEITERGIWELRYRDVVASEGPVRRPDERGYDYISTTPHLEECIYQFEKILESMLELAAFESKFKRLSSEILKTTREIRVLEERVLPELKDQIRVVSQHLGEREREAYYSLKRFKASTP